MITLSTFLVAYSKRDVVNSTLFPVTMIGIFAGVDVRCRPRTSARGVNGAKADADARSLEWGKIDV